MIMLNILILDFSIFMIYERLSIARRMALGLPRMRILVS